MDDKQRNRIAMYKVVKDYLAGKTANWELITANGLAQAELVAKINDIDDTVTRQMAKLEGHTADKSAERGNLHKWILRVAGPVSAFAAKTGDNDLLANSKLTKSELEATGEQEIDDVGTRLAVAAEANLAGLVDYGVTSDMVDDLQAAITAFDAVKTKPKVKRAERAALTAVLEPKVRAVSKLLSGQMDGLMAHYEEDDPEFFEGYRSARVIHDLQGPGDDGEGPVPDPVP